MPPQSRGGEATSPGREIPPDSYNRRNVSPPTLQPYLDNRPISPDLPTPTSTRPVPPGDRETPTPTPKKSRKTSFVNSAPHHAEQQGQQHDRLQKGQNGERPPQSQMKEEDSDEEEDDEFDSHYSRQSSSPSSSIVSGLEMGGGDHFGNIEEETEDDEEEEDSEHKVESGEQHHDEDDDDRDHEEESVMNQQHFHNTTKSIRQLRQHASLHRVASLPASSASALHLHPSHVIRPALYTSRSTTSLPPAPPPPLFPPFYNRPPTPLPPSPSLTSLLRPPSLLKGSATSTRPTTPEDSDAETPNDTEAAVAQSARRAHPLPPTSPKVPTYEYYGFVLYLASYFAFLMYLLWSYLPSPFLHAMGITYYPNRWWSLALPAWIVMGLIWIYVALLSYNVEYLTLPMNSLGCMVDEAGNVAVLDENARIRKGGSKKIIAEFESIKKERISTAGPNSGTKDYFSVGFDGKKTGNQARHSNQSGKWTNGHLSSPLSSYQNHPGSYSYNDDNLSRGKSRGKGAGSNQKRKPGKFGSSRERSNDRRDVSDGFGHGNLTRSDSNFQNQTSGYSGIQRRPDFKDMWELELEDSMFRGFLGRDVEDYDSDSENASEDQGNRDEDEDDRTEDGESNENEDEDQGNQHIHRRKGGDGSIRNNLKNGNGTNRNVKPRQKQRELDWLHLWNEGTDAVMDVPIAGVCEILYGDHY